MDMFRGVKKTMRQIELQKQKWKEKKIQTKKEMDELCAREYEKEGTCHE